MENSESNPYDPNVLPVRDEYEVIFRQTLCESYAHDLIERAAERRREIALEDPDEKRHLQAAIELDRLAVEVRALAGSPLEATFNTALLFAEGDCQKINVLAIQKEHALVRSIGFGSHCPTGVDFIATVIGYWLEAALEAFVEPELDRPQHVADTAAVDRYMTLSLKARDLRDTAHCRAINAEMAKAIRDVDRDLGDQCSMLTPGDRRAADDWLQWLANLKWGNAL